MMKNKILFLKSLTPKLLSTEEFVLKVRDDPKYDNNPLINKEAIDYAFKIYDKKLNPLNKKMALSMSSLNLNIEGQFIAQNIPEIPSVISGTLHLRKPCPGAP